MVVAPTSSFTSTVSTINASNAALLQYHRSPSNPPYPLWSPLPENVVCSTIPLSNAITTNHLQPLTLTHDQRQSHNQYRPTWPPSPPGFGNRAASFYPWRQLPTSVTSNDAMIINSNAMNSRLSFSLPYLAAGTVVPSPHNIVDTTITRPLNNLTIGNPGADSNMRGGISHQFTNIPFRIIQPSMNEYERTDYNRKQPQRHQVNFQ